MYSPMAISHISTSPCKFCIAKTNSTTNIESRGRSRSLSCYIVRKSIKLIFMSFLGVHKTSLTLPLFSYVPVPSPESERTCRCVLVVSILPLSMISRLNFWAVSTAWYIFCFSFYYVNMNGVFYQFTLFKNTYYRFSHLQITIAFVASRP
jgi:hypothetical protein